MDLDGDGVLDILSGSYWPGDLYLFRGEGKGRFKASEIIKDKDGKPVRVGYASTVFAYDWRGTGKLDLLCGCIEGFIWLVPNEGTRTKPKRSRAVAGASAPSSSPRKPRTRRARPVPAIVYAPRAGDIVAGVGRAIVSAPTRWCVSAVSGACRVMKSACASTSSRLQ